ncbi:MAG: ADP-ribosylation factor-like protein [Candidatus Thorarchaeota archaeon]
MLSSDINDLIKISIIGHPAVGKTTILKLLCEDTIDRLYFPTQGFDLKKVKYGNFNLKVWDFGGQKAYLSYLKEYLVGSDLVVIVTDSTPLNVLNSRQLIEFSNDIVDDDCPIIAIANKQDLCKIDGRMDQNRVEDVLQVKTYGLTAINRSERVKFMNIIKKELNQVLLRRGLKELMNIIKNELNQVAVRKGVEIK